MVKEGQYFSLLGGSTRTTIMMILVVLLVSDLIVLPVTARKCTLNINGNKYVEEEINDTFGRVTYEVDPQTGETTLTCEGPSYCKGHVISGCDNVVCKGTHVRNSGGCQGSTIRNVKKLTCGPTCQCGEAPFDSPCGDVEYAVTGGGCQSAVIENVKEVNCNGVCDVREPNSNAPYGSSCNGASFFNVKNLQCAGATSCIDSEVLQLSRRASVACSGYYSCAYSNIDNGERRGKKVRVSCLGPGSCDSTTISLGSRARLICDDDNGNIVPHPCHQAEVLSARCIDCVGPSDCPESCLFVGEDLLTEGLCSTVPCPPP